MNRRLEPEKLSAASKHYERDELKKAYRDPKVGT